MNFKPIYIAFISLATVLVSCTTESNEEPTQAKGSEMSFAISDISRSSITKSIDDFAVYGDMTLLENGAAESTVIFNKTEVKRENSVWTYQGIQYWFPNHEHSFVAVYPQTVLETKNAPLYDSSKLTFSYILPSSDDNVVKESEVVDVVAATHRRLYGENEVNNVITFRFAHLLSQINFSLELTEPFARSEECYKIHKLAMSGFGTEATINVEPASLQSNKQTNDSKIDIVTAKGNGSLTVTFDHPIEVINGAAAVRMFDSNNAIIMLPQAFEDNDKVQISLTYTANDEAEETQVSAELSNFKWESGRSYNYKIKLELEQKEVNMDIREASIVPWNLVDDHDEVDAR